MLLDGQKSHADAVGTQLRKSETQFAAFAREELVGNLDQDSRSIAGFRIAPAGTAVGQVQEHLNSLTNDVVALVTADACDKPDSTGVVLVRGVVKALGGWKAVIRV